jgi:hypothetical protein
VVAGEIQDGLCTHVYNLVDPFKILWAADEQKCLKFM